MRRNYLNKSVDRFSMPRRLDQEEPVRNGLAVTPSRMLEMTEKGIPISTSNQGVVYDEGVGKLDFDPPAQYRRGVDIGDLWELRESVKAKFRKLRDEGRFKSAGSGESAE